MSEGKKKRRGLRSLAAVVSAVALGIGGVAVPQVAGAAPFSSMARDLEGRVPEPSFDVSVVVEGKAVVPGGDITFVITPKVTVPDPLDDPANPKAGESNNLGYKIWFQTDGHSDLSRAPQPEDFTWASGETRPFAEEPTKVEGENEWAINFGEIPGDDHVTRAELPGKVNASADPAVVAGAKLRAGAIVEANIRPETRWTTNRDVNKNMIAREVVDGRNICHGTIHQEHVFDGGAYPAYLFAIWFGTNFPEAQLSDPHITVYDPNGNDITNQVLSVGSVGDPTSQRFNEPPEYGDPNFDPEATVWKSVYNWPVQVSGEPSDRDILVETGTRFVFDQNMTVEGQRCDTYSSEELAGNVQNAIHLEVGTDFRYRESAVSEFTVASTSIGDRVWVDANANGIQDDHETQGVPGVEVTVSREGEQDRKVTTDADGNWVVDGLTPGVEYDVKFNLPVEGEYSNYVVTKQNAGTRESDSNGLEVATDPVPLEGDFSYDLGVFQPASIGDFVWEDTNGDGIQDDGEPPVPNTIVRVTGPNGETHTTATDKDGKWSVDGLTPGVEYTVEFTPPAGYQVTKTEQGEDRGKDSNPLSSTVTLESGENNTSYDLGLIQSKPELASVGDRVWIDANRNGVQDEGEENLADVKVTVTPPAGSDEQPRTATTDADGKWRIDELTPGVEYTVAFELPDGYKATDVLVGDDRGVDSNGLRSTVTLKPGEYNETYDLGVFQPASIGDFVWEDTNGDGIQDDGEPPVPNTIVRVTGPNGETHTTATDKDGKWSVDGLTPGVEYTVEFTPPAGYQVTKTEQGEDRGKDSNPLSSTVSLKPGENNTTYDLGLIKPASVGDRVWVDENENGIQDENEKNGVPNAKVTVTAPEGVDEQPRTTTTDDKGNWRIDGLTPGVEYTVTFELPEGVSATKSLVGDDRGVDSNELSTKITLESGQHDPTIDLGVAPASIGDRVWLDEGDEEKVGRADGIQDEGEGGLADVVVRVSRPGEEVRETKTDAGGTWKIEGLTPGVDDYRVEFDAPDGYRISPTKAGDAAVDSNGLSDKVAALKSGEFNDTYDLGLFIEVPETTTVTTPVPTVETTTVPTPCDCSPTTVPKTVTSKVPVPTTKTQSVPTTLTTKVPVPTTVPTTTTQVMSTTKTTEVPVPTTLTTEVPVPTTKTQAVPTTLTTQVPVPTTLTTEVPVPTTVTSEVPVPTTVPTTTTQAVPTTVEKPVPVPTTVRSTTTAEAPKRGTIGDKVWEDTNGDGKEDPDEKTGIPNVPVVIVDKDGNEVTRTVTDKDGNWKVDVEPGEYTVRYEPGDRTPSDPEQVKRTVTIKPGEKRDDIDLGVLPSGSVGDRVWNDEDGDGEQGEDEKGIPNVIVEVSREGEPTRTTHTDENGDWKIEGLNPNAEYDIRFIKPEGWEVTGKVPGSDESGLVSKVTVKPGEYNDSYDLGLKKLDPGCDCEPVKPGTIGDRVWIDLNGNGKQDPNETEGAPDVTVIVRDKDGNEVTRTVTDEDGNWKVTVEPGDYEIEYRPRDWKPTDPKRVTQKVTVEEGKEYLDLDLGVQKPKPGEPTPPTGEPQPQPEKGSSTETLDRCVANAVRSPLLYLVPVALLGAFGGEIARPYMGAINEQVNQINAQFQEAMRRNSPDWGQGGRGGRDDDQFAELRGQIDAANRRIAELGQDPNVQRFGTVAAGIIGLIAAGGVLYDWCSNEKGEAFTSIGGSSSKDAA